MEGPSWRADFEATARAERKKLLEESDLGAPMLRSALYPESSLRYPIGVMQAAALQFAVAVAFIVSLVDTRRLRKKLDRDDRARARGKAPMGGQCG